MKTLKLWIGIGKSTPEEYEIPILDDDATYEELNQIALDAVTDIVEWSWEVVDE